jgi:hypothetical protein
MTSRKEMLRQLPSLAPNLRKMSKKTASATAAVQPDDTKEPKMETIGLDDDLKLESPQLAILHPATETETTDFPTVTELAPLSNESSAAELSVLEELMRNPSLGSIVKQLSDLTTTTAQDKTLINEETMKPAQDDDLKLESPQLAVVHPATETETEDVSC